MATEFAAKGLGVYFQLVQGERNLRKGSFASQLSCEEKTPKDGIHKAIA